jgi:hypothetical protein
MSGFHGYITALCHWYISWTCYVMLPWKPNNAKQSRPIVKQGWMVQILHPSHNFEPQPFQSGWSYGIVSSRIDIPCNGITYLQNFIQIYQLVQKLFEWETQTHRDRQTGEFISLLSVLESRLKSRRTHGAHLQDFGILFLCSMVSLNSS